MLFTSRAKNQAGCRICYRPLREKKIIEVVFHNFVAFTKLVSNFGSHSEIFNSPPTPL